MYNTELSDDVYTVHCSVRNNLLHFRDNDVVLEVVKTLSSSQNEELTVDFCTEHIFHNYRGKQFFKVVKKCITSRIIKT